jgi:hypothetical protein
LLLSHTQHYQIGNYFVLLDCARNPFRLQSILLLVSCSWSQICDEAFLARS